MAKDEKVFSNTAMDSMSVAKIQGGLDDLQRSLTVAYLKEAIPAVTATQSGSNQPVASTGSQSQSNNKK